LRIKRIGEQENVGKEGWLNFSWATWSPFMFSRGTTTFRKGSEKGSHRRLGARKLCVNVKKKTWNLSQKKDVLPK
jgi:hypothetical protein